MAKTIKNTVLALLTTIFATSSISAQAAPTLNPSLGTMEDPLKTKSIINEAYDIALGSQAMVERFPSLTFADFTTSFIRKYSYSIIQLPEAEGGGGLGSGGLLFSSLLGEEDLSSLKLTFLRLESPLKNARISSGFGWRWGRAHQGTDFAAAWGTPIYAAESGTVAYSGWSPGYGKLVSLDHGESIQTNYGHCSRLSVNSGDYVTKGQVIGYVGSTGRSTGPHLHFEVIANGVHLDPEQYLNPGNTLAASL